MLHVICYTSSDGKFRGTCSDRMSVEYASAFDTCV